MARRFSLPSFLTGKRSRLTTAAIAGTLTLATAASAAAATLPSGAAAAAAGTAQAPVTVAARSHELARTAPGIVMSAPQQLAGFDHVRFSLRDRQGEYDAAVAKAAAVAAAKAAAAKAAAAQATAAQQQAVAQVTGGAPSGSPEQIAAQMLSQYGWPSSQFSCLYPLWEHESGWNPSAENPSSGAYGIPQSMPGSQMASAGADWQTNPATQIKWGLTYIQGRYGSPCGAWAHEEADGWY